MIDLVSGSYFVAHGSPEEIAHSSKLDMENLSNFFSFQDRNSSSGHTQIVYRHGALFSKECRQGMVAKEMSLIENQRQNLIPERSYRVTLTLQDAASARHA